MATLPNWTLSKEELEIFISQWREKFLHGDYRSKNSLAAENLAIYDQTVRYMVIE